MRGLKATPALYQVSTVDPHWATVFVRLREASGEVAQPTVVILHRVGRYLHVLRLGKVMLGCGVPAAARRDLGLTVPLGGCG